MIKLLELIDKNIKMVLKILYTHTHTDGNMENFTRTRKLCISVHRNSVFVAMVWE